MTRIKTRLAVACFFAIIAMPAVLEFGCSKTTLDPNGPYAGDKFLYEADGTIVEARKTMDGFLTWELQNRSTLAAQGKQTVTGAADSIRTNAPIYFAVVKQARAQYIAGKGPGTSNSFFQSLAVLQTQTITVQAVTNATKL